MPEPQGNDNTHFAPGMAGIIRWMGYWLVSRAVNGYRATQLLWRSHVLPVLWAYASRLTSDTRAAAGSIRNADGLRRLASTSEGARSHGLTDAHT